MEHSSVHKVGVRSIIAAGTIGTIMEWYIFFVYSTGALYISHNFFPKSNAAVALISTFLVYSVGFFVRPIGGFIFGHLGDKIGRNTTLIMTITVAGLSGGLIGVLPTYAQAGFTAVIILAILRVVSGISLGGEWGGAMILSLENVQKKKGFYAAFVQSTVGIGLLLGAIIFLISSKVMSSAAMYAYGWRIPFLFSFVILVIGLYLRLRIPETPLFKTLKQQNKLVKNPIGTVLRKFPKEIILGIFISGVGAFFAFGISLYTVVLEARNVIPLSLGFTGLVLAGLTQIIVTFFSGTLSDRIGRRPTMMIAAVMFIVVAYPAFLFMSTASFFIYSVIFPFAMALGYAPNGAILSEIFPTNVRYSGSSIAYQVGNAYLTGPTALISEALGLVNVLLYPLWPIFIAIGILSSSFLLPETKGVELEKVGETA